MPVTVSLLKLADVSGTRDIWPDEFRTAMDKVEADVNERDALAVLADWLKEHDEPWLEKAFRFYLKRPTMTIRDTGERYGKWEFTNLTGSWYISRQDDVASLFVKLAEEIKKRTEELE